MIEEEVAVEVFETNARLPDNCFPIVCEANGGPTGTLGSHRYDSMREIPAARVFVEVTSGLNAGSYSVSEVASHELVEMLVNPDLGAWLPHVGRGPGIESPVEIADPVQDTYEILSRGTPWKLSNWVLPSFWNPRYANDVAVRQLIVETGAGVDWAGRLARAGDIGPEGYSVFRERRGGKTTRTWSEDDMGHLGSDSVKLARKQHAASRTKILTRER